MMSFYSRSCLYLATMMTSLAAAGCMHVVIYSNLCLYLAMMMTSLTAAAYAGIF